MATMETTPSLSNPKSVAEAGEKIYKDKYKQEYERDHLGEFVAIDVRSQRATLGDSAESALERARQNDPNGIFHLIRVGFTGAFQVSYSYARHADNDWLFG